MRNEVAISKMILYGEKIIEYCHGYDTYGSFSQNSMLMEACVFNLSQIGELTKKLDDSFNAQYADIPWSQLRGLRNRIVHDYEGVNLVLVWDIIHEDLPELIVKLKNL